jgi:hypothetical protein
MIVDEQRPSNGSLEFLCVLHDITYTRTDTQLLLTYMAPPTNLRRTNKQAHNAIIKLPAA